YYFTLPVADVPRAQRFFGAVLGWQFGGPGPDQQPSGHIENISAPPGSLGGSYEGGARLWFVVDDIHAAVALVRSNGGTADEPVDYPSGWSADCVDDQGTVFSLSVPVPEYTM
ncbi:MAG: Glyoxalase/bleomycin resistance protein/dioxygenase, partial [Acidimicrobiales bacterium]|nr:Glyoxalase/bleomycin resistance protein/dioxygenase [Acidimicrobiales bacterium]